MKVLGINAVFHDPAAALVVDGVTVAASEEERFSRRKHGKRPVPFSAWELPEQAARWCLERGGVPADELDAVAYSYDPAAAPAAGADIVADLWEGLRTLYAERVGKFLASALPGAPVDRVVHVPHHVAHAASAYLAGPSENASVITLDGRGEAVSHLSGRATDGKLDRLASTALPDSLGLRYEDLTAHLGFRRSSDEYKVMALAAYGDPVWLPWLRERMRVRDDGTVQAPPLDWSELAPARVGGSGMSVAHADLAASVQARLEEVMVDLARWIHERTGDRLLVMAGGVALNCVANSRVAEDGPFERVWVQPAAGDAGTALGAALYVARSAGDPIVPMTTAALGRSWDDAQLAAWLEAAAVPYTTPDDVAEDTAAVLADNGIVAWFQGRSEFGPRALGNRSLLADPRHAHNVERLNDVKGREQFRPVAPMVLADRAAEIFEGPLPSPYMLFTHRVRDEWRDRIPGVVHVDGTARIQTVDEAQHPLLARLLRTFEARTGVPVLVNTSLNTAGRPMVDDPRDALECFGSAPIDVLALGGHVVRRGRPTDRGAGLYGDVTGSHGEVAG